jgi:actin-related protein
VSDQEGSFLGDDVKSMRDFLDLKYPVERGIVNNWDDMENILKYTIEKRLKTNAMLHPIMITESPSNHKANREKMTEVNNNIKKVLLSVTVGFCTSHLENRISVIGDEK